MATQAAPAIKPQSERESAQSPWVQSTRRILRNPGGRIGVGLLVFFIAVAIFAPLISPYDPVIQHAGDELLAPNGQYLLGTDEFGRDLLSRIIWGTRISLTVGLISVAIGFAFGATTGLISGYLGGWVDAVVNRLWDCLLSFPTILLGIAVVLVTGPGAVNAAIAVGISNIPIFARLARACALTEKERDYVLAARTLGSDNSRIVFRHIMPNALSPLIVQSAVAMAFAVLLEASLSFLGLGAQPPEPSWGSMLSYSRQFLRVAWYYGVFPGVALTMLLIGLNYFSDAMRDALDPRQINVGR
ncbi:MAG: ABC transporter permease [Chloroflexi bacterium]|nr:ABC transporter permease [Chloroflexota bacterium]